MKNLFNKITKKPFLIILPIIILVLMFSLFTTINSGEVGIRVRLGKVLNNPTSDGINIKIPFIECNNNNSVPTLWYSIISWI